MADIEQAPWTIQELVERAEQALQTDYVGQWNRRVRDLPSLRTIRLYTTLGLLDRPVLRGRTGYYGPRHLMQLVAIKRLQSEGLTLSEVQTRLLGLTDETLADIAKVPPQLLREEASESLSPNSSSRRQTAFWKQAPLIKETPSQVETASLPVRHWQSVELAEGVHLLIETQEPLSAEVVQELQHSAQPLLRTLRRSRITRMRPNQEVKR